MTYLKRILASAAVAVMAMGGSAFAATINVPADHATIQDAVDAASSGDTVRVGPGDWCGATIERQLDLFGEGGATIVGCSSSEGPVLFGFARVGFFLPNASASGTTIRHFVFDGGGISVSNLDPLSFAVFSRNANNIIVEQNRVIETVQAITNTEGSGWTVNHNVIENMSLFVCGGSPCGGGDAIVFQDRTGGLQTDNSAMFNSITGIIPDDFNIFDMAGIVVFGQNGVIIEKNRISIPGEASSNINGIAILVDDKCCGSSTFAASINSVIVKNDGRGSQFSVVITPGNASGTVLRGNFGVNDIEGNVANVTNRSIDTLIEFP